MGFMGGAWRDVHGAGSQRSDPKAGDPANFPQGRGPQGDAIRIYNFVRLVRSIDLQSVRLVEPDLVPLAMQQPSSAVQGDLAFTAASAAISAGKSARCQSLNSSISPRT
jgi:hypothetical protein